MNEKKKKKKSGAKKKSISINWDDVKRMCEIHCTEEEIAAYLEIDHETLLRGIESTFNCDFRSFFSKHRLKGHISLRQKQYEMALYANKGEGSENMLKWLGKNWLGQMDKPERQIELESQINAKLQYINPDDLSDKAIEEILIAKEKLSNNTNNEK